MHKNQFYNTFNMSTALDKDSFETINLDEKKQTNKYRLVKSQARYDQPQSHDNIQAGLTKALELMEKAPGWKLKTQTGQRSSG